MFDAQGRHFKLQCVTRIYDADNSTIWTNQLYGAEVIICHRLLLQILQIWSKRSIFPKKWITRSLKEPVDRESLWSRMRAHCSMLGHFVSNQSYLDGFFFSMKFFWLNHKLIIFSPTLHLKSEQNFVNYLTSKGSSERVIFKLRFLINFDEILKNISLLLSLRMKVLLFIPNSCTDLKPHHI